MLDCFEIVSTSGVVLWSKSYTSISPSLINSLIKDVFIEERSNATIDEKANPKPSYRKEGYTLKWTTIKDLGLIFVAVYQSLLHLSWIDQLLDNVRTLFSELYGGQLKKSSIAKFECDFTPYFDRQIEEFERLDNNAKSSGPESSVDLTPSSSSAEDETGTDVSPPPIPVLRKEAPKRVVDHPSTDVTPIPTPSTSRPSSPAVNHLLTAKAGPGKQSRRARKAAVAATSAPASSGDESSARTKKGAAKKMRTWDASGYADEDEPGKVLDYSAPAKDDASDAAAPAIESVSSESWGTRTKKGEFVLKDLDDEMDSIIAAANAKSSTAEPSAGMLGSSLGTIGGLFRNIVGGKTLTKEDLVKPLKGMEDHLVKKNVAREAAERLCESAERDLLGMKTSNFTSIETTLRNAMEVALRKILTPTTSLDILREIQSVTKPTSSRLSPRPYTISIVGVNGVGKSTNLSKLAFFLLQNRFKVLIVAGDTFRSGAVEQLRVHVRNLKELAAREGGGAQVDLYERGYGKDAANVAGDAVAYAKREGWDVVLIDTAGRRHNDQRLMSSLEKFAKLAKPDKILMVGEALVGSDSVQQARNFNAAFGAGRKLDGFIISKCDTVGDMVGVLVSMVHATGIPVVFLGVGQHYADLRTLSVSWAVKLLMS
ncbi:P-loop containing nucleoside triphosphate hydrolase protein [Eremomyces bilateralis CBS 781.70]|uniref:Signal recognition particle receptor subunit alpha homolog n=1 Tax=Eremomyces bilateralis CBS 781.70 TaxID=1392243 RepID=A0A6G1FSM6_9PEZI|nr:P-loop containing nucleoside triphosphate hydrolase protein [Eremomyces bilateralis CBS 781.70]KAF1808763.1 P-loop containing nucleoside triphosphate hydrolase protein [Eremomyces bilateralis CBS 781.70]